MTALARGNLDLPNQKQGRLNQTDNDLNIYISNFREATTWPRFIIIDGRPAIYS